MSTRATFTPHPVPNRTPDYMSDSGSQYWYTPTGVIRYSNHWNMEIDGCYWELAKGNCGYCAYTDFVHIPQYVTIYKQSMDSFPSLDFDGKSGYITPYYSLQTSFENCRDGYVYFLGNKCRFRHLQHMSITLLADQG